MEACCNFRVNAHSSALTLRYMHPNSLSPSNPQRWRNERYCVKGGITTEYITWLAVICGRMTQAGKAVIDQQKGTEAGVSGNNLGAPSSL